MIRFKPIYIMVFLGIFFSFSLECAAHALDSRYATITYFDHDDLREFNNELYMGRLKSQMGRTRGDTIEEKVIAKINFIVEKVMMVLDMFPPQLMFSIVIHPNEKEVQKNFYRIYNIDVEYIAFYSPSKNRVFYSASISLKITSIEILYFALISMSPTVIFMVSRFFEYCL
ncbi:MAG: hypothetical protein KAH62_03885 [Desulfobacula sp.]|nr:hypothetical protein [Desulfobacula sp.]